MAGRKAGFGLRVAILVALLSVPLFAASPARAASSEFYGIAQGTLDLQDYEGMQAAKVHSERFLMRWRSIEPTKGSFDWTDNDNFVGQLASHGIRPLPFVWGSPTWVGNGTLGAAPDRQRRRPDGVAGLPEGGRGALRARRHLLGTRGEYDQEYGTSATPLPIQSWQIWNEPNLKKFFAPGRRAADGPEVRQAAGDLPRRDQGQGSAGHDRARRDARAYGDSNAWDFLNAIYDVAGVKDDFDAAALHPYGCDLDRGPQRGSASSAP